MADKSTLYRASIELSDVDRGRYESLMFSLAMHPSETATRLLMRLLAYALCYEPELELGKGVGDGESPDLWVRDGDGRVLHWIETGLPSVARITKAARVADQVTLFTGGDRQVRWEAEHGTAFDALGKVERLLWPAAFLEAAQAQLSRNLRWSITRNDGAIYVDTGAVQLETELQRLSPLRS